MLGFSYDWDREVDTTDPKYFKWTQWIFLQIFNSYLIESFSEQCRFLFWQMQCLKTLNARLNGKGGDS